MLCAIPYDDEDDAVRIANDSKYGLAGGVASASPERAMKVARRIRSGIMSVNGGDGVRRRRAVRRLQDERLGPTGRHRGIRRIPDYQNHRLPRLTAETDSSAHPFWYRYGLVIRQFSRSSCRPEQAHR